MVACVVCSRGPSGISVTVYSHPYAFEAFQPGPSQRRHCQNIKDVTNITWLDFYVTDITWPDLKSPSGQTFRTQSRLVAGSLGHKVTSRPDH